MAHFGQRLENECGNTQLDKMRVGVSPSTTGKSLQFIGKMSLRYLPTMFRIAVEMCLRIGGRV